MEIRGVVDWCTTTPFAFPLISQRRLSKHASSLSAILSDVIQRVLRNINVALSAAAPVFAPETTSPKRNEHDRPRMKMQQNQRS